MPELQFENKTDQDISINIFQDVLNVVTNNNEISVNSEVSLVIVDSKEMKDLNGKYRGLYKPTDVLSFPCEMDFIPFLGDIIIDIYTADRQKGLNSLSEELQILFLHGLLHLLGHDHLSVKQKQEMQDKEKYYTKLLRSKP